MKKYVVNFLNKKFNSVRWPLIVNYIKEQSIKFIIEVLIWIVSAVPILIMYFANYFNYIVYGLVYISLVLTFYSILEHYKEQFNIELRKQRFNGYNF